MMNIEFIEIISDIIKNDDFIKLKNEVHHGTTRYEHSIRVAKQTYLITKKKGLNYVEATRAALLHDFFQRDEIKVKHLKTAYAHPIKAYENSKKYYSLSGKEANIIRAHMFPLSKELPKSKEAIVVTYVDKKVAMYEFRKFGYKYQVKNIKNKISYLPSKLLGAIK